MQERPNLNRSSDRAGAALDLADTIMSIEAEIPIAQVWTLLADLISLQAILARGKGLALKSTIASRVTLSQLSTALSTGNPAWWHRVAIQRHSA